MSFLHAIPTPLAFFEVLVGSDSEFPLLEAAASLAQDEYPELDLQQVLDDVDHLLDRVRRRLAADAAPLQRLRVLNRFFYEDLGFGGNLNDYYDPDNSYLNVVLRTRRGIPISLAVLWLELAQGLRLNARGVGFPGHFLVKVQLSNGQVVLDPLTGRSLSRDELRERLEPFLAGAGADGVLDAPLGLHLQSSSPRDIVARMLRNLQEIHTTQEDWARLLVVLDRRIVLSPQAWEVWRDRGLVHAELGHTALALRDLETYLRQAPRAPDAPALHARVAALRATS